MRMYCSVVENMKCLGYFDISRILKLFGVLEQKIRLAQSLISRSMVIMKCWGRYIFRSLETDIACNIRVSSKIDDLSDFLSNSINMISNYKILIWLCRTA
ncbi:hypothetical protein RF11_03305 [Thelohanellus kitauei]|uniref:Uncharacterized protein n=1 Tax=Thelohanellus kitauei TaxID=669202 RepID=A0A0C2MFF7_THEKT|nr:hypothetical protein RF11_03305 [Thelohanellus kitauei]